jgi:hypothetical protein
MQQRNRRAQMTNKQREEIRRKQREYQHDYRAQKKATSQNATTPRALTEIVPNSSTIGT